MAGRGIDSRRDMQGREEERMERERSKGGQVESYKESGVRSGKEREVGVRGGGRGGGIGGGVG